jgi:hypothetical protein
VGRVQPGRTRQRRRAARWPGTGCFAGLKKLLARDYDISSTIEDLKKTIQRQGQERQRKRIEDERAKAGTTGPVKLTKQIGVPRKLTSSADIDALIQQLQEIKAQLSLYAEAEITIVVGDTRG